MEDSSELKSRKPVWIALSEFYLDDELEASDFKRIAEVFVRSPYSWKEIKRINKYEIFPLLQPNLLSVAGVWGAFDSQWLTAKLSKRLKKHNFLRKMVINVFYGCLKWMCTAYWAKTKEAYWQAKHS